ncbi:RES family NAD+ phosphorylase [Streptomyces hydrogenans]|uniref:RES family NAD+ phosphorylase n=1 Tax=Streptomyces hydrogenans TaxID=1873719 RepID=UPI0036B8001B
MKPATVSLTEQTELYRLYPHTIDDDKPGSPAWFCGGEPPCRFDLRDGAGTCYVASTALGAFIEVFLRVAGIGLSEDEVHKRHLAIMQVSAERILLNLNSRRNFGILNIDAGLLHETNYQYSQSQALAVTMNRQGIEGVQWLSLRDPASREMNYALFAPSSGVDVGKIFEVQETGRIPDDLIEQATNEFDVPRLRSAGLYPGGS